MVLLTIVTIICIGMLIGVEFAVSVFINPVIRQWDAGAQANAIRMFARRLGKAMPPWYIASFALLITEAIVHRHAPGKVLLIIASALWAAVILLTILFLVPINNRMAELRPEAFSVEAKQAHKKWDALHRVRVGMLGVAMVCFLLAVHI